MKKENNFLVQIIIEIVAIFIGITLALIIDQFKENRQTISEVKSHFNLIINELSKDSLELQIIESKLQKQINDIDLLCLALKNEDNSSFNEQLTNLKPVEIYNPRTDEINFILNSSSFSQIYNDSIFSHLNNLKSDCKNFDFIQKHEYQLIKELKDQFILPYLDYNTQLIDIKMIRDKNYFLNKLQEYSGLIDLKKAMIGVMKTGSTQCIEDMKSVIK
ncbi:hypothetical protein [Fluviicola sp.]|uniref:hypothetical protein n=1 Tax=Fluviicola sp. TaxID=1917219 RepID=UPI0031D3C09F